MKGFESGNSIWETFLMPHSMLHLIVCKYFCVSIFCRNGYANRNIIFWIIILYEVLIMEIANSPKWKYFLELFQLSDFGMTPGFFILENVFNDFTRWNLFYVNLGQISRVFVFNRGVDFYLSIWKQTKRLKIQVNFKSLKDHR